MTYTYRAEPVYKKSIVERQMYVKDDVSIVVETGWRGGHFVFESDYDLEMTEDDLKNNEEFCVSDHFIIDMETWDGCWTFFYPGTGATEADVEVFEELWGKGSWELEEEEGWELTDSEFYITGAMTLVDETEEGTVHEEKVSPSSAWPFPIGGEE
jgi:hypothetical protein